MAEDQVVNPVSRIGIEFKRDRPYYNSTTVILIITPEGLKPFFAGLWRLTTAEFDPLSVIRAALSGCSLTLDFNVKASIHRKALRNILLKPRELLHGVKELALIGDIGDPMHLHLQRSMLEGPFPAEAVFNLTKYHTMALRKTARENPIAAQWRWSLHDAYSRYLTHLSSDPFMEHRFKEEDNDLWAQM